MTSGHCPAHAAAAADGKRIVTLEGMQEEAKEFGAFMANEGAEQCGFCNPGFIMNVFAMLKELEDPTEEDILEYLSGICAVARDLWDRPEVS